MSNLISIINRNGKLVVSSREVAKNFDKRHDHVVRDVENYIETLKNTDNPKMGTLFIENEYTTENANGVYYKEYLLTRDGFTLLAMGFTGKKAFEWKLKYIEAFNKMEKELKEQRKLSPMDQLKLQYEVLDNHEERLEKLENNMTIDYAQQRRIENKAKSKAISALGGTNNQAYKNSSVRGKVFSSIYKSLKDCFMVSSYRDIPRNEFDKALEILDSWQPEGRLLREIDEINKQLRFEIIK